MKIACLASGNGKGRSPSQYVLADIMVGSFYDPDLDEGCAFEELISFHGGLGGPQTRAFLCTRRSWPSRTGRSSARPTSTRSCAAGAGRCTAPRSDPAAPSDRRALAGPQDPDVDLRRNGGCGVLERQRGRIEPSRGAAGGRGATGSRCPSGSGSRSAGRSKPPRLSAALAGIHVARPHGRPQPHIGTNATSSGPDLRHPGEQVGVAGEVDAPSAPPRAGIRAGLRAPPNGRRPCDRVRRVWHGRGPPQS